MEALINFFTLRPTFTVFGLKVVWYIYLLNAVVQTYVSISGISQLLAQRGIHLEVWSPNFIPLILGLLAQLAIVRLLIEVAAIGGYFYKQPDNSELCDQSEDQRNKVWRPHFQVYPSLRQYLGDARDGNVSLNDCVQQVNVPNDLQSEDRKSRPERKKIDQGFHAKLPLFASF